MFVPRYSQQEAAAAVAVSRSYAETLRRLDLCATGGNWLTLMKWLTTWRISTKHFDRDANRHRGQRARALTEVLVEGSTYSRAALKRRLYDEGIKQARCEQCGQGEVWRGRRMGLILDHINGVRDDNRIENLQIVCPNCAATLDTHCARKNRIVRPELPCLLCGQPFRPRVARQRYCSRACGTRSPRHKGVAKPLLRRAERPPYHELLRMIEETSWRAVGRRYGVSDNAIRKWVRQYEREREAVEG